MSGPVTAPTRAAVLQLQDEQKVVNEAYTFLDEKRLVLASELLRQLMLYKAHQHEIEGLYRMAREALRNAVMVHGLEGLQVYPALHTDADPFKPRTYNFMGVKLVEVTQVDKSSPIRDKSSVGDVPDAVFASEKAETCRRIFADIVNRSRGLAALSGNLYRLLHEYRLTERRSRALENVILPEIKNNLRDMIQHLEELDLEDAVRVHLQSGSQYL